MPIKFLIIFFLIFSACSKKDRWSKDGDKKILYQMSPPISQLDPQLRSDLASGRLLGKIYESLYEMNPYKNAASALPDLALALPEISKDGLTYTVTIKKDVFYQPCPCFAGIKRSVIAEDFVTAFKRLADPHLAGSGFGYWKKYIWGLEAWHDLTQHKNSTNYALAMSGIKALNDHTLQFKLLAPDPIFVFRLATMAATPIPMEAVTYYKNNLSDATVGTGPFILKRYDKARFEFSKNPDYREKFFPDDVDPAYKSMSDQYRGKKIPFLDGVTVMISQESQTGWLQFLQGNVDYLEMAKDNTVEYIASDGNLSPELKAKGIRVGATIPKDNIYYLGINNKDILLSDKRVRQAIAYALDRQRFLDLFFRHRAILAQSMLPAAALPLNMPHLNQNFYPQDLTLARQLLTKVAQEKKLNLADHSLTLLVRNSVEGRQIGDFFQSQLMTIGLNIKLETVPINVLIDRAHKDQFGLFYLAWFVGLPSPLEFYELLYGPNYPGSFNRMGFQHSQFDKNFERFKHNMSDLQSLREMQKIVYEEVPLIPLVHASTLFIYHPWLMNYIPTELLFGAEQYFDIKR